jgi:hypothetical protein
VSRRGHYLARSPLPTMDTCNGEAFAAVGLPTAQHLRTICQVGANENRAFESRSSINEPSCSKVLTPRSGDDPANYFADETETLDHHRNLFAFPLVEFTSRYLPEQDRRRDTS